MFLEIWRKKLLLRKSEFEPNSLMCFLFCVQKMEDTVRILYTTLMALSSLASVSGNLLLLLLLLLNKELRTDTLGLTLSFSLSDLALGMFIIPIGAYNGLTCLAGSNSGGPVCQGSAFVFILLQTASIFSFNWVTVNRFTEICFALSYDTIWTPGRRRAVLVLVWTLCFVMAAMPLLGFGTYVYSESRFLCSPSFTPDNRCFVAAWILVGVAIPIFSTCSLYGYMVYVARKQARRGTFMCNELHCFYVPANNFLRSSLVMITVLGEFICYTDSFLPVFTTLITKISASMHFNYCIYIMTGQAFGCMGRFQESCWCCYDNINPAVILLL